MKLTQEDIKKIIPHRDPFLFLDEVIDLKEKTATGIKYVKLDEPFFEGHFPGLPVMPGVLIIESLAQVGAVILLSDPKYHGKIVYFTGIKDAKFRKSVLPGDTLILKCELTKMRGPFGFGEAKAYVNDELVCETNIAFAIN
jgi:3-hydroxyacyl-[acyl-carrier-protein] dehydratase